MQKVSPPCPLIENLKIKIWLLPFVSNSHFLFVRFSGGEVGEVSFSKEASPTTMHY